MSDKKLVSNAFQVFASEAPQHAAAWNGLVQNLAAANALDQKTAALAYLSVLAVLGMESGIPFHVNSDRFASSWTRCHQGAPGSGYCLRYRLIKLRFLEIFYSKFRFEIIPGSNLIHTWWV